MFTIAITPLLSPPPSTASVEMVERKGTCHPDTLCDALAETISTALCRYYIDHFGLILHHNVDKALLWGGASQPAFNGGVVLAPMELFLAGRATCEFMGKMIPVDEIAVEASRHWLKQHMHALDIDQHVKFHPLIRPGSSELVDLYLRQKETGVALANDTSCGVGYAPLDELEKMVLGVEQYLNAATTKEHYPEIGEDIKIMAVREGEVIALTIGCAFIDRHIASIDDYRAKKQHLASLALDEAQRYTDKSISISINAADSIESGSIYLTVTGTSAEAGDDGEVGRGNRSNGLITPYRPMNMEAAAGKNPVTHVGKLYNILAQRICATLVQEIPALQEAQCYLVSRIGQPIHEPQVVDIRVRLSEPGQLNTYQRAMREITQQHLQQIQQIQEELIAGSIKVY